MSFITSLIPVLTEDPFLKYRPFPAEPANYFEAHWHEAIVSFLFYTIAQQVSKPISAHYFGKTYTSLKYKTKVNFDIHVVSMVQCFISISLLLPMWNHSHWQNRVNDPLNSVVGYTPYGGLVASLTLGYFLWDLMVCLVHFDIFGIGFLFHGFAAAFVFGGSLRPFCNPWIPAFLLFELSTPFVNINWFASRLPAGTFNETFILFNGLALIITFFSVRILWGLYAVSLLANDMFQVWNQIPSFLAVTVLALNASLDFLNIFWFQKMIAIARKKLGGKESTKEAVKEVANKID
ncbi:TLC domain-containing protein [Scheffersomyces amazonensis]|uniref:TLC domain-containing protein n=1 Tax=Scheffersomyces amazonensis TaxID=1078765 RepID=UPI00315D7EFE